jgi:DNA-binding NarL/FixJ family response regulator
MPPRIPTTPGLAAEALDTHAPIGFTVPELVDVARGVHLSPRETDVLILRLADLTAKEIGARLGLSPKYVSVTLNRISQRLGVRGGLPALRRRTRDLLGRGA